MRQKIKELELQVKTLEEVFMWYERFFVEAKTF